MKLTRLLWMVPAVAALLFLATETHLQDGQVLLAGGYANDPEAAAQTWIYRP